MADGAQKTDTSGWEPKMKFKTFSKLKNKEDKSWSDWSNDADTDHPDFNNMATDLTQRTSDGSAHTWDCYKDLFQRGGIPLFQVYDGVYLEADNQGYCVQSSTVPNWYEYTQETGYTGPQIWTNEVKDIDGNVTDTETINECMAINALLDKESRENTRILYFQQKKFTRVGQAMETAGFVGKTKGYSIFVHHLHLRQEEDAAKAELAANGYINQGGFMVCIAPDKKCTYNTLEEDAQTWTPAFHIQTIMQENQMPGPYIMKAETLRNFCESFLEWNSDISNYKN